MLSNRLPIKLLILFLPIWAFTGFVAFDFRVWLGESALVAGFIIFLVTQYRRRVLSASSYWLIFIYLIITKIGVTYGYENVPADSWAEALFGFSPGEVFDLERNHYDRFAHFSFGLLLYLPIYEITASIPDLKSRPWTHLIAFMAINASSAIYEIIEMLGSYLIEDGTYLVYLSHQGDVLDAPKDMAMALLGSLIAIGLLMLKQRRLPATILLATIALLPLDRQASATQVAAHDTAATYNATILPYGLRETAAAHHATMLPYGLRETAAAPNPSPTADEIIQQSLKRYKDISLFAEVSMQVVRPAWQSTVDFRLWALADEYALVLVTGPARDRGQAFLKRKSDLWHWIPSIDRTIRMSDALLSQSWMGSDFSLSDVLQNTSLADDYRAVLKGSATVDGVTCHHLELFPHHDAPVVWGKVETWIAEGTYDQVKALFYDDQGQAVQLMEAGAFNSHNGRRLPGHIHMTPLLEQGLHTVMHFKQYDLDSPLEADFFSHQQMRRLR